MTKQDLIDFEQEVAEHYNAGRIRGPVHLSSGNEDQLIEIFHRIKPTDSVTSTWRSRRRGAACWSINQRPDAVDATMKLSRTCPNGCNSRRSNESGVSASAAVRFCEGM